MIGMVLDSWHRIDSILRDRQQDTRMNHHPFGLKDYCPRGGRPFLASLTIHRLGMIDYTAGSVRSLL